MLQGNRDIVEIPGNIYITAQGSGPLNQGKAFMVFLFIVIKYAFPVQSTSVGQYRSFNINSILVTKVTTVC